MNRPKQVLIHLVCIAALIWALPAFAAEREAAARSSFEGVQALERPITLSETKIPLGELIQKIAAETGVKLTATREVADEPVALVVKEMPARELLEQVAGLLDHRWSRQGKEGSWRYEIGQDLAAKQREEALRQAQFAAVERRLREEIRRHFEIASLPAAQFQALLEAEERSRQAGGAAPQDAGRFEAVRRLWTPANRALARLLGRLTPAQWETLRGEGYLSFASDPDPGEQKLSQEMETAFRSTRPAFAPPGAKVNFASPEQAELHRQTEEEARAQWSGASGYRVLVHLKTDRFRPRGEASLSVEALPYRTPEPYPGVHRTLATALTLAASPEEPSAPPAPAGAASKAPVLGVKKAFRPTVKPKPPKLGLGTPVLRFRDLLPDLARTYDVQFLSDAYWASSPQAYDLSFASAPVSLAEVLECLAGGTHQWDRRERLVRMRSRTWFFDRPREVPMRLVRRWQALAQKQQTLTLDEYADIAVNLTDAQLDSIPEALGEADIPSFSIERTVLHRLRHELRLYGSLAPAQRQALWSGKPQPVRALTADQRALFLAAIQEHSRAADPPEHPDLSRWAEGRLSLSSQSMVWFHQGGGLTLRPAPSGAPPPVDAPEAAPAPPGGQPAPGQVRGAPRGVLQVGFQLQWGPAPGQAGTYYIRVAASGG